MGAQCFPPPERANAFSIVRSVVAEASSKSWPLVCKLAKLSATVLERDALSVVNEMFVLVLLVQVSATAKLPPRLRVVFEVLNEAPLANVVSTAVPKNPSTFISNAYSRFRFVLEIPLLKIFRVGTLTLAS